MRAIESTNAAELAAWARYYHSYGTFPITVVQRMLISIYQTHQALRWGVKTASWNESWAACAIHAMAVGGMLKADWWLFTPPDLDAQLQRVTDHQLLDAIGGSAQMVMYGTASATNRSSRFNSEHLARHLVVLILGAVGRIPREERAEAFFNATAVMVEGGLRKKGAK